MALALIVASVFDVISKSELAMEIQPALDSCVFLS